MDTVNNTLDMTCADLHSEQKVGMDAVNNTLDMTCADLHSVQKFGMDAVNTIRYDMC